MKQKCTKTKNARLRVFDSLISSLKVSIELPKVKQPPWYSNLDVLFFMHKVQQRRYLRANWKCMMSMLIIRISNANNIWVGLLILIMLIEIDYINWTLLGKIETMNNVFVSLFVRCIVSLVVEWERCAHLVKLVTDQSPDGIHTALIFRRIYPISALLHGSLEIVDSKNLLYSGRLFSLMS